METFKNLVLETNRHYRLADHITNVTYPLLKDSRLLLSMIDNLDKCVKCALDAYIYIEKINNRISVFPTDLPTKLHVFSKTAAIRHNVNGFQILIREIDEITNKHKESPVEFIKDNKLYMYNREYKARTLDIKDIKLYLLKTKPFIVQLNNIYRQNELDRRSQGRD